MNRQNDACWGVGGIPFGLRDGRMVDVSEVERGRRCACRCPACDAPLIARKGTILRHHFAHISGADCAIGLETSIHRTAKQVVLESRKVMLPGAGRVSELRRLPDWGRYAQRPSDSEEWLFPPTERCFAGVEVEKTHFEPQTGRCVVPDLTCDAEFLVEFLVSHSVDGKKKDVLHALGLQCIEIDLRPFITDWLDANRRRDPRPVVNQLQDFVLRSALHRQWLYENRVKQWLEDHKPPEFGTVQGVQLDLLRVEQRRFY